jgi:pimeloyl-ACP methyl ester carboxylesterase
MLRKLIWGFLGLIGVLWVGLMAYAYWPTAPEIPVAQLASSDDRFVNIGQLQLRYRRYGVADPARPQLILIHGFANSLQSWRDIAPRLADCCDVVAIDLPGFGLSDKPVDFDYGNRAQAQRSIAVARALGFSRPIYAGHSLGGAIALQAGVHDANARGVALLNPGIISTGVPKIVQLTIPPLPRLSAKMFADRAFRERFLKQSYANPAIVTDQLVDDLMLGARTEGYMAGMTSLMKQYNEGEEIVLAPRLQKPVLILWGDRDRNKPAAEREALQALLPGAALVRFANAGHYVHEEAPAEVAVALRDWLASLP